MDMKHKNLLVSEYRNDLRLIVEGNILVIIATPVENLETSHALYKLNIICFTAIVIFDIVVFLYNFSF